MENIGRAKMVAASLGTKRHKKTVAMCDELRFWATTTDHALVEGEPSMMRDRKIVTAWSKDRDRGAARSMEAT